MIDEIYIYIFFLIIIFFIYGLVLSEIIDHIIPSHDENKNYYYTTIEIIIEIGLAYLIYFLLNKNIKYFIHILINKFSKKSPAYIDQLLLISFSFGIYKHLEKSTHKMNYLQKKFINFNKVPF